MSMQTIEYIPYLSINADSIVSPQIKSTPDDGAARSGTKLYPWFCRRYNGRYLKIRCPSYDKLGRPKAQAPLYILL